MKYCNFPSMMILVLVAAHANLSNMATAQAFGEDDLQLQAKAEVSRMKKENLQQQRDESRKLQQQIREHTSTRLGMPPELEQKAGKTEAPSTSNVPSASAEPSIEPSNLPTVIPSAEPSMSLKGLVLALLARVDTLESEVEALEGAQADVAALLARVEALENAQADVTACVTYDSGAEVCTIGDDLTSGSGISFDKTNGNVSLKTNKGSFSANVAQDIILKGSDSYIGTGDADFNSGAGIRFEPKGAVSLNSGTGSAKVILKGTEAYIGTGAADLSSGAGVRFGFTESDKGNSVDLDSRGSFSVSNADEGSITLKSSQGGLKVDAAQDISFSSSDGSFSAYVDKNVMLSGGDQAYLKGEDAYIGTGPIDHSSGGGIRFTTASSTKASNTDVSLKTSGQVYIRGESAQVVLKGTEAYIGTGASDLSSGAGVRFGFTESDKGNSVDLDSRGSFSVSNADEGSITLKSSQGGLYGYAAQDIYLSSSRGSLKAYVDKNVVLSGGDQAYLNGADAYIGTGPIDQSTGSGIRFDRKGNAFLRTNTGSFSANAARDITMRGGSAQVVLKGTEAYIGTGAADLSSGAGVRFGFTTNKDFSYAVDLDSKGSFSVNADEGTIGLKSSQGGLYVDAAQDIYFSSSKGSFSAYVSKNVEMSGGDQAYLKGEDAYIGTGPIDHSSGGGIRFTIASSTKAKNTDVSLKTSGQVYIESGENRYLTGTCDGPDVKDVCGVTLTAS